MKTFKNNNAIIDKAECKKRMLNILREFHSFCLSHNLKYSIWYGTAIGAIRHRGFIPWDDDIDVVMPRDDYDILLSLYKNNDDFQLFNDLNKNYHILYAKLCDAHTCSYSTNSLENTGVFIDIFPLDYTNGNPKTLNKINKIVCKMRYKNIRIKKTSFSYNVVSTKQRIKSVMYQCVIPIRKFLYNYSFLRRRLYNYIYSNKGNWLSCLVFPDGQHYLYDKDFFDDTVFVDFEGLKVLVTKEYDKNLHKVYGNYMIPPKESERYQHSNYSFYLKQSL